MEQRKLAYKIPEAARMLSLSRTLLYELMARGELQSVKIGRSRRITEASLMEFLAANADTDSYGNVVANR